jgi:hypothetical protein
LQERARKDVDGEAPVHRRARQEHEPDGEEQEPRHQRRLDPEAKHEPVGEEEPEVLPDRRQRDVHDRRVEDDHQIAAAEDD